MSIPPSPFEKSGLIHTSLIFGIFLGVCLSVAIGLTEFKLVIRHPSEVFPILMGSSMLMGFTAASWGVCRKKFPEWSERRIDFVAAVVGACFIPALLSGFRLLTEPGWCAFMLVATLVSAWLVGPKAHSLGRFISQVGTRELAVRFAEKFMGKFGFGTIVGAKYRLEDDWESLSLWLGRAQAQNQMASLWSKVFLAGSALLFVSIPGGVYLAENSNVPNWFPLVPFSLTYCCLTLAGLCYLQRVNARLARLARRVLASMRDRFEIGRTVLIIDLFPEPDESSVTMGTRDGEYFSLSLETADGSIEIDLVERTKVKMGRSSVAGSSGMRVQSGRWEESLRIKMPGQTAAAIDSPPVREYSDFQSNGVTKWRVDEEWLKSKLVAV